MAVRLETRIKDGRAYYIIGAGDISDQHIIICDTIEQRNALAADGFVLVKNAAGFSNAPGSGDPTVHRGWAMYIRDVVGSTVNWIKVAEQESVEGIWSVEEEYLRQFCTRKELEDLRFANNQDHTTFAAYGQAIQEIRDLAHEHTNRSSLDRLGTLYGILPIFYDYDTSLQKPKETFKPVGNVYIYSKFNVSNGIRTLRWNDDTYTVEDSKEVATSAEIAEEFAKTRLAINGMILRVVETDLSLSDYILVSNGESIVPFFVGTTGGNLASIQRQVTYVDRLPVASNLYLNKGYYYLLPPAGCGNQVNRFYQCVKTGEVFSWVDISAPNSLIPLTGAKITTCFRSGWNEVHLTYDDIESPIEVEIGEYKFAKTYIVRKFGSSPVNKDDGVIVSVVSTRNKYKQNSFIDVHPLSKVKVYYAVFTEATNGKLFSNDTNFCKEVVYPDWSYLKAMMNAGHITKVISVGDILVAPKHTSISIVDNARVTTDDKLSLDLQVAEIDEEAKLITLVSKSSIGKYPFDTTEYGMKPSSDTTFTDGKDYYSAGDGDDGKIVYTKYEGDRSGSPAEWSLFELNGSEVYNPAYVGGYLHGSKAWLTSNLCQWLNADAPKNPAAGDPAYDPLNWFTAKTPYDRLNITEGYKGYGSAFKYGFVDTAFKNLISEIRIPNAVAGGIPQYETGSATSWVLDTNGNATTLPAGAATVTINEDPETYVDVHPVFILDMNN